MRILFIKWNICDIDGIQKFENGNWKKTPAIYGRKKTTIYELILICRFRLWPAILNQIYFKILLLEIISRVCILQLRCFQQLQSWSHYRIELLIRITVASGYFLLLFWWAQEIYLYNNLNLVLTSLVLIITIVNDVQFRIWRNLATFFEWRSKIYPTSLIIILRSKPARVGLSEKFSADQLWFRI